MAEDAHVSTGRLPAPERVQAWLDEAHARFAGDTSGEVSRVYPALAEMPAHLFGICVVSTAGRGHAAGDARRGVTVVSVSQPVVVAPACARLRPRGLPGP